MEPKKRIPPKKQPQDVRQKVTGHQQPYLTKGCLYNRLTQPSAELTQIAKLCWESILKNPKPISGPCFGEFNEDPRVDQFDEHRFLSPLSKLGKPLNDRLTQEIQRVLQEKTPIPMSLGRAHLSDQFRMAEIRFQLIFKTLSIQFLELPH
jgi:hypothetical protein